MPVCVLSPGGRPSARANADLRKRARRDGPAARFRAYTVSPGASGGNKYDKGAEVCARCVSATMDADAWGMELSRIRERVRW